MNSRDAKDLRKQLRNVVQEQIAGVLNNELVSAVFEKLSGLVKQGVEANAKTMNERLDKIEEFCRKNLKEQNDRSRAIQGFLMQTVQHNMDNQLHNMYVTMLAWQEVMAEKLGASEEFNKQIDERKKAIAERLQKEHEEKMQKAIEEKKAAEEKQAAEQKASEEQKPAEQPQPEQQQS